VRLLEFGLISWCPSPLFLVALSLCVCSADFGASKLQNNGTVTGQSILSLSGVGSANDTNDTHHNAATKHNNSSGLKGTPNWMSPEVIKGECHTCQDWQHAGECEVGWGGCVGCRCLFWRVWLVLYTWFGLVWFDVDLLPSCIFQC
jgi:serine/threonine protein kinase